MTTTNDLYRFERCDNIIAANEYYHVESQCERPKGHKGPHIATLGPSSRRIWDDVDFPINYVKEQP